MTGIPYHAKLVGYAVLEVTTQQL